MLSRKLHELRLEAVVGEEYTSRLLRAGNGLEHSQLLGQHESGDSEAARSVDASLAVDQTATARVARLQFVCCAART